jgi:hypothetical protein
MLDQFDHDQAEYGGDLYKDIHNIAESLSYLEKIDDANQVRTLKTFKDYLKDPETLKEWDEQLIRNDLYDEIITEAHDQVVEAVSTRRKH